MNNIINAIEIAATIIGLVFTIVIVNDIKLKLIICLSILVVILCVKIVTISIQKNRLQKEMKDAQKQYEEKEKELNKTIGAIEDNRCALITQYKEKKNKVDTYESFWSDMNYVLLNAIQGTADDRFLQAYNLYKSYTESIRRYQ